MIHNDDLEKIKHEEAELLERLAALRREKQNVLAARRAREEAERLRLEQEKVIRVYVKEVRKESSYSVVVEVSDYRQDLFKLLDPYSKWKREFHILPNRWLEIVDQIKAMPNILLEYEEDVEEDLDFYQNAPDFSVELEPGTGNIQINQGPKKLHAYGLSSIPGARHIWKVNRYVVPGREAWRIPTALEGRGTVEYTEEARKLIFQEIERRAKLDKIAKQEDCSPEFLEKLKEALPREVFDESDQTSKPFWQFLRPFQRVNLEFVSTGFGRYINGDDTGLGKTVEAIAMAELLRHEGKISTVTCVLKAANIPNWIREIRRFTGFKPVCAASGTPSHDEYKALMIEKVPYFLISYDTLGSKTYTKKHIDKDSTDGFYPWKEMLKEVRRDILVLDEAHQIKNPATHRFKAIKALAATPYVWPMTASPILNRTGELWTNLYMVAPDQFGSFDAFVNTYTMDGRNPRDVEKLHELIRPIFLRRRKKDVQKDLPPINRLTHLHKLSPAALKSYDQVMAGLYVALEHFDPKGQGGDEHSVVGILSQITRLKQVCAADKVDYTAEIAQELSDENNGRVLIFSQFKGTAAAIAQRLGGQAVCTVVRKEDDFHSLTAKQRDELFESVRHDKNIKFIVTTEAAKEGHNLEFCDYVIFNDQFWTPEGHRQCEGRSYGRLSNPHPIDSIYVIADIEIERWISELLQAKMALIERTVDGVETSRDVDGSIANALIQKVKDHMLKSRRQSRSKEATDDE